MSRGPVGARYRRAPCWTIRTNVVDGVPGQPSGDTFAGAVDGETMSADEDRLEDWVQTVQPLIVGLAASGMSRDAKLDFGADSPQRLEELALERFACPGDLADEDEQGFVQGAVAYTGETLMRVAGGSWIWEADTGSPAVQPDAALGLAPVSPLRLLAAAAEKRDGNSSAAMTIGVPARRSVQRS
jgi:hypothetical protein